MSGDVSNQMIDLAKFDSTDVFFRVHTDNRVVTLYPTSETRQVDSNTVTGVIVSGIEEVHEHIGTFVTRYITVDNSLVVHTPQKHNFLGRITSVIQGSM